jgi:adenylate cyclase
MAKKIKSLSILFADISKSSHLYEILGDQAAQGAVGNILNLLSDLAAKFTGTVIKTVGDAIICIFDAADNAICAAKSMQETMIRGLPDAAHLPPINIHIGIHHGPVVVDKGDIFGDAVNITARVADYANPRQIVATRAVIENLSEKSNHHKKYLSKITAKNISGKIELFEIILEDLQMTMVIDSRELSEALFSKLYLTKGGQNFVIDAQKPVVSVGRDDFNDIVIHASWISRTHAYIENRNGIFMVKDKSTNGTYIHPVDSGPVFIKKGEHPLTGKGVIVFGRDTSKTRKNNDDLDTIDYHITTKQNL